MKLKEQLAELEKHIKHRDVLSEKVSKVPVAWHIDHSLKVVNGISTALKNSKPEAFKPNMNIMRSVFWLVGDFPRGAKSPKQVLPPDEITNEAMFQQLEQAHHNVQSFSALPEKANFDHFYFGLLHKKNSIRFMEVHTNHHLKIIREILRKRN